VANVIIGLVPEEQLRHNLGVVACNLASNQVPRLDAGSEVTSAYPYCHQGQFLARNPVPVCKGA
jgi:hypothetical protein